MGGHRQPRQRPAILAGQDATGKYQSACVEFADDLGWEPGIVCHYWSRIALARMRAGQSQDVAEDAAMRDVKSVFDKRGAVPS